MKSWMIIIFLVSAITLAFGRIPSATEIAKQEHGQIVPKIKLTAQKLAFKNFADGPKCTNPDQTVCQNNRLTFCGINNVEETLPCELLFDGKSGFCDCEGIQCIQTRPVCPLPEPPQCSNPGEKMPDASDCRKFTYCDEDLKSVSIKCPIGFNYNPKKQRCDPQGICNTLQCNIKKTLEWIPFPAAPQYYLFCLYGQGEVRKCTQENYTMQNGKCQFQCTQSGLFRDPLPTNCQKGMWHACSPLKDNTFVKITNYCPKNANGQQYFNEERGVCEDKNTCPDSEKPGDEEKPAGEKPAVTN